MIITHIVALKLLTGASTTATPTVTLYQDTPYEVYIQQRPGGPWELTKIIFTGTSF